MVVEGDHDAALMEDEITTLNATRHVLTSDYVAGAQTQAKSGDQAVFLSCLLTWKAISSPNRFVFLLWWIGLRGPLPGGAFGSDALHPTPYSSLFQTKLSLQTETTPESANSLWQLKDGSRDNHGPKRTITISIGLDGR